MCLCTVLDSVSVLRAHQLRLRLSVRVLSVPDMPRDDGSRQHVSIYPTYSRDCGGAEFAGLKMTEIDGLENGNMKVGK